MKYANKNRVMLGKLYFNNLQRARSMMAHMGEDIDVLDKLRQPSDSLTNLLEDLITVTMRHLGNEEKAENTRFAASRRVASTVAKPLRGEPRR
ncbi:MAG: hypothetical protein U1F35_05315 [Steroidobacteraceae bacterium]